MAPRTRRINKPGDAATESPAPPALTRANLAEFVAANERAEAHARGEQTPEPEIQSDSSYDSDGGGLIGFKLPPMKPEDRARIDKIREESDRRFAEENARADHPLRRHWPPQRFGGTRDDGGFRHARTDTTRDPSVPSSFGAHGLRHGLTDITRPHPTPEEQARLDGSAKERSQFWAEENAKHRRQSGAFPPPGEAQGFGKGQLDGAPRCLQAEPIPGLASQPRDSGNDQGGGLAGFKRPSLAPEEHALGERIAEADRQHMDEQSKKYEFPWGAETLAPIPPLGELLRRKRVAEAGKRHMDEFPWETLPPRPPVDELAPRELVTKAGKRQTDEQNIEYEWPWGTLPRPPVEDPFERREQSGALNHIQAKPIECAGAQRPVSSPAGARQGEERRTWTPTEPEKFSFNKLFPPDFPRYYVANGLNEISAYLANASYVVSLGGPPASDLKYGIVVVPLGEESLLLGGSRPDEADSKELRAAVAEARRKEDAEFRREYAEKMRQWELERDRLLEAARAARKNRMEMERMHEVERESETFRRRRFDDGAGDRASEADSQPNRFADPARMRFEKRARAEGEDVDGPPGNSRHAKRQRVDASPTNEAATTAPTAVPATLNSKPKRTELETPDKEVGDADVARDAPVKDENQTETEADPAQPPKRRRAAAASKPQRSATPAAKRQGRVSATKAREQPSKTAKASMQLPVSKTGTTRQNKAPAEAPAEAPAAAVDSSPANQTRRTRATMRRGTRQ